MLPLSERYRTSPYHAVHLFNWSGIVFHPKCHGVSRAHVSRTPMMTCSQHTCHMCFRNTGDAGGMLFRCVLPIRGRFWKLTLICAGVKHVHMPSARTAYRKMMSMLSEIPYQNCLSLLSLISSSWTDQRCSFSQLGSWI